MQIRYKKAHYLLTAIMLTLLFYSCKQDVSVTPPDNLPPAGYIYIDSRPGGARIFLDGKDTRRITPDSLNYLPSGNYKFTLKKELFRDTTFSYDIVDGERKTTLIDYTKNPLMLGNIYCDSSPRGADIFLNDSATGKVTPASFNQLLPGSYKIRYHYNNYKDNQDNILVQSSKISAINMTLIDTTIWREFTTSNSPISSNKLTCLSIDKNNTLWIGTEDQGIAKYDGYSWEYIRPQDNLPNNLPTNKINVIETDANGNVWVGTDFGLLIYTYKSIEKYNSKLWNDTLLIDPFIKDITSKPDGRTLLVTDSTLFVDYKSLPDTPRALNIQNDDYYANYGHFTAVEGDNNNNFWIGTVSKGVFTYNNSTYTTKKIYNTTNTREIGDSVTALAISKTGTVWIGYKWSVVAGSGLSSYNGALKAQGVIPFNKNTNSIFIDNSNRKWIGTNAGLVEFSDVSSTRHYDKASTGLDMDDVRGIAQDQQGRIWIATYGGGLFLKKK